MIIAKDQLYQNLRLQSESPRIVL